MCQKCSDAVKEAVKNGVPEQDAITIHREILNAPIDWENNSSCVHKLEGNQDAIDALFNMFLDKTKLSVLRPLVVGDLAEAEADDPYGPSSIMRVKDATQVREIDIQEPGNAVLQALNRTSNTNSMAQTRKR